MPLKGIDLSFDVCVQEVSIVIKRRSLYAFFISDSKVFTRQAEDGVGRNGKSVVQFAYDK